MNDTKIDDLLPLKPVWLHLLLSMTAGHRHGYAMRKEVERRTAGQVRIWPATLYRGLAGLIAAGLVLEDSHTPTEDGDRERRLYLVTERGKLALAAEMRRLEALVREARVLDILGHDPAEDLA
jgi:DNA-binding PadR family transcriptional regulator